MGGGGVGLPLHDGHHSYTYTPPQNKEVFTVFMANDECTLLTLSFSDFFGNFDTLNAVHTYEGGIKKFLQPSFFSSHAGADPGYVKGGGGEIQKGGQVADIT